jgi:hypothetical protein
MWLSGSVSSTINASDALISPQKYDALLELEKTQIKIKYIGEFSFREKKKLEQWIRSVGHSMTHIYGQLPLDEIYITFTPYREINEPVPFAKIMRGSTQGINFHVNPSKKLDDFINDWTAYHEFSHLMIPYPSDADLWFSEGLASYYQNIIMGRMRILSPIQAWQKIYDGFLRGSKDTKMFHFTLKQLSPTMRENSSFMRVYWTGAYYFLSVDIALRQQNQSLDTVLFDLQRCCLQSTKNWTALGLIKKMDQLSNTLIFSDQYRSIIDSYTLTGFESRFEALGLSRTNDTLFITPEQPVQLYQQIMTRPNH